MRYARYLRLEKYIAASDTGGIVERWRYGRRLLEDGAATTPAGNLRHGVLGRLIANAAARGHKLTQTEINRRLRCAKAYATEPQISRSATDYGNWWALVSAGFPAVEAPEDAEPYDPRDADERRRDAARALARRAERDERQPTLFDYFPDDRFDETATLADLAKYAEEMDELTERFARRDRDRQTYLQALIDAAGGDMSLTWAEAHARLTTAAAT